MWFATSLPGESAKHHPFLPSFGLQPWRHQAGGPVWRGESGDPPCVPHAEYRDVHALDGGGGGEQVRRRFGGGHTDDAQIILGKIGELPLVLF